MTDSSRESATPTAPGQLDFAVEGMTCGSCAARIQRVLGRQPGVASAEVNFATSKARVAPDGAVDVDSGPSGTTVTVTTPTARTPREIE